MNWRIRIIWIWIISVNKRGERGMDFISEEFLAARTGGGFGGKAA